ncbi:IPT/TIG domain-containing protein [Mesoterricola silvestris]|uniref:IPT/TIG domain-containing protein n=1 Tax=Mesoterricola silvestris TaxID=2927979 RepID=A0AA48H3S6_9BACT|nr:IPT/TIG domain-containing protein [Mesoterricola silvestris]BDU71373.1 hypothetical protein METEAL_05470 [Mesoterricola silvestris]
MNSRHPLPEGLPPGRSRIWTFLPCLALGPLLLLGTACSRRGGGSTQAQAATAPAVTSIAPDSGFPGDKDIIITGTGFTGAGQVLFGGTQALAFTVESDTRINASLPATLPSGAVSVSVRKGAQVGTSPSPFTVKEMPAPPVLTSFSPQEGIPGTVVTLTGSGFLGITAVTFGGVPASSHKVVDGNTVEATVPEGASTGLISITGITGTVANSSGDFTVVLPGPAMPHVESLAPATGVPGTAVTLTGSAFLGATEVRFGGLAADAFQVNADGTRITTTVPAGAATGAVLVLTPGGTSPATYAAIFTVEAPQLPPSIAAIEPDQGIPGTEVTVTGTGLAGITGITYGGLELPASRYSLDSSTSLRVRIPDDAQVGGSIGVITGTPPMATSPEFVMLPSRRAIAPHTLTVTKAPDLLGQQWLNYPDARRSAIYQDLSLPLSPVFHAYNPGGDNPGLRDGKFVASYSLSLLLPPAFLEVLPRAIQDRIKALGVPPANVQILVSTQNYAYDGVTPDNGVYLFRPHYWTDPDAPNSGIYYKDHALSGGIFEADPKVTLSGHPSGEWFDFSILTHGPSATEAGPIVASGNTEPMAGFDVTETTGLYSVVQDGDRVAVTLHILLNDEDQATLDGITATPPTLGGLFKALLTSGFAKTRGIQLLGDLTRPVIATVTHTPVPGAPDLRVTLTGSALTGAQEVLLNGTPLTPLPGESSDAILRVDLPAGSTGNLQVVTPLGTSDPVPLP